MYRLIKPLLFKLSPMVAHRGILFWGGLIGKLRLSWLFKPFFNYENDCLKQNILGISFPNPVGLGAGFDKDALLLHFLPSFGFGFLEIGSITYGAYPGNEKPWLVRLPMDKSIVVNFGLKGEGADAVVKNFGRRAPIPFGINIAATNKKYASPEEMAKEYVRAYRVLKDFGDYITLNISCPNAFGGENFCHHSRLGLLLDLFNKENIKKPVFVKLMVDLPLEEVDKILSLTSNYSFVSGFIVGNLTKERSGLKTADIPSFGGLSGKPCFDKALKIIKHIHETNRKYIIIGLGGVFTTDDAYQMLKAGASLVQLITGMIYNGPGTIKKINKGLVKIIKEQGFDSLPEALNAWHNEGGGGV